eukprot:5109575-Amphidinium_carterae.1
MHNESKQQMNSKRKRHIYGMRYSMRKLGRHSCSSGNRDPGIAPKKRRMRMGARFASCKRTLYKFAACML